MYPSSSQHFARALVAMTDESLLNNVWTAMTVVDRVMMCRSAVLWCVNRVTSPVCLSICVYLFVYLVV